MLQKELFVSLSILHQVRPLTVSIESLIKNLEKEVQHAHVQELKISGPPKQLRVVLSGETSDYQFDESSIFINRYHIEVSLPEELNVSGLIATLKALKKQLLSLQLNQSTLFIEEFLIESGKLTLAISKGKENKETSKVVPINKEKLLLIDGSNLLSKGFYGTSYSGNLMQTSDGRYTNGVYSMVNSFFKLLITHQPTHVAFLWDEGRKETWRAKMYPEYKGHRGETEPELKEQFETARNLLEKINVFQLSNPLFEADDIIGTIKKRWILQKKEGNVLLVSSDKDLYQLLDSRTIQTSFHKGVENRVTEEDFKNKYGVTPSQWVDIKALLGDKSDNIPGCRGVGDKAAYPLIQKFNSLEGIFEDLSKLEPEFKGYVKKLEQGKKDAFLSKKLATIETDIEGINVSWDDLRIKLNKAGMIEAFKDLEFDSLIKKIS